MAKNPKVTVRQSAIQPLDFSKDPNALDQSVSSIKVKNPSLLLKFLKRLMSYVGRTEKK